MIRSYALRGDIELRYGRYIVTVPPEEWYSDIDLAVTLVCDDCWYARR
jgi:hypothetical protein